MDTEGAGPWAGRWSKGGSQERVGMGARAGGQMGARPSNAGQMGYGSRPGSGYGKSALPKSPAPSGQITVHYDEGADAREAPDDGEAAGSPGLRIGAKLRHSQFGIGEVRGWQSAGADLKVTMRFPTAGIKTILARFLTRP